MKKSIATLMLLALFGCLNAQALADSPSAALQPVKTRAHHARRHRAHKAVKHHRPKRPHHSS